MPRQSQLICLESSVSTVHPIKWQFHQASIGPNQTPTMATNRLLRTTKPLHYGSSSSSSFPFSLTSSVRYQSKAKLAHVSDHLAYSNGERKPAVAVKASVASEHTVAAKPAVRPRLLSELAALAANVDHVMHVLLRTAVKRKLWSLQPQALIETAIIDCRFFTLFAVVGSLLGSILCFIEGCFLVIESYVQYFHMLSQRLDQGHVVQPLIEAIDMFLVGTAMLIFGVGLYVMFVRSRTTMKGEETSGSNLLGIFQLKSPPRWAGMQSIAQAKAQIGHAVMMILQVGLLDKFKDIPLVTGFDLACFAGAVLTSSACIFLLSKTLSVMQDS